MTPNADFCFEGIIQDVGAIADQEKAILQRERLSEALLVATPDLYLVLDSDGTVLEFRKAENIEFWKETSFIGRNIRAVFSGTVRDAFAANLKITHDHPDQTVCFEFVSDPAKNDPIFEGRILWMPTIEKYLVTIREKSRFLKATEEGNFDSLSLKNLIEKAPFPIFVTSIEKEDILYVNERAKRDFAFDHEQILGKSVKDFYLRPSDRAAFLEKLYLTGSIRDYEITLVHTDGSPHGVLMSATVIHFEGRPAILISLNDISERKKIQEEIRISEEKYRFITDNTLDVIWVYRPGIDKFTYVSPAITALRGISVEEAMGETLKETMTQESFRQIQEEFTKAQCQVRKQPGVSVSVMVEIQQLTQEEKKIWVEVSATYRRGLDGDPEVIGVSRNIQERKKTEKEVLYLNTHDQLTGLFNRRYYEDELKQVDIERNLPITLIMADVNGLKLTNDAFGHSAGDKLLQALSDILMKETGPNDVVARVGGDEFVIILKKTGSREAELLVSRITNAISSKQMVRAILSVSFGWKTKTTMSESMEDIYKQSEDDMYRNKLYSGTSFKNDILNLITKSLFDQNSVEQNHAESVSQWCGRIGLALGMDASDIKELSMAGLLHDIGKIAIPESILMKNGTLTESEMVDVRRHPEIGYQILRSVSEFANIAQFVLNHHERMDGSGYPRGLKGDDIPMQSRIIAIAEAYDSIVRKLPYRKPRSKDAAIEELSCHAGTHFDAEILSVFIEKVLTQS